MLRHRWKILIGIVLVFVVWTSIEVTTIGNGPKKEVEAYKKSLIAKGEKLEISELLPPSVPPEQNGADVFNQALGHLAPEDSEEYSNSFPALRMIAPGKAIVCFEQPDVRGSDFTNSWVNVIAAVEDNRPITELLKHVMNYPAIDFHVDYGEQNETSIFLYPSLIYEGTRRLSSEAMCDLHSGDAASATTNICAILALVNGLRNEWLLNFQTMRNITTLTAGDATWELLQSSNVSDSELVTVQGSWERVEPIHVIENEILVQRALDESGALRMQTSEEYFNERTSWAKPSAVNWSDGLRSGLSQIADNARLKCCKSIYHGSWIYSDELQMLQDYQLILETVRTAETNRFFNPAYSNMIDQLKSREANEPDGWLGKLDKYGLHGQVSPTGGLSVMVGEIMGVEAMRRIVITSISLKRYRLKYGKYPASLSDLTPEFIPHIPLDPVDGKPLRYQLMADGTFLLYSIGQNGRDDGGDGSIDTTIGQNFPFFWSDPEALDWVWPQPATAAEIQYFYAHPPPKVIY